MLDPEMVVYVVDPDTAAREAYRTLLQPLGYRFEAYPDAESFLERLDAHTAGCVILEAMLPGIGGSGLQEELKRIGSPLSLVFSTAQRDIDGAVATIKQGALGYLLKPIRDQQLLDTINRAMRASSESVAAQRARTRVQERLARLTPRERQVLRQLMAGAHHADMAAALNITKRTVEAHRRRIMEKLSAKTLPQLLQDLAQVDWSQDA
jgi:FixJ family two-component response regulator